MFSWLVKTVTACCRSPYVHMCKDEDVMGGDDDPLLWCKDLEKHSCGEFSFAVVQANDLCEDHSQVDTGREGTFVGVYDGHGGPEASRFVRDNLLLHLIKLARENRTIDEEVLKNAFAATEDDFLSHVRRAFDITPSIASKGCCCLVGVIWKGTLYVANLGDSRAVLGHIGRSNKIVAEQLTKDHNASIEEVRNELMSLHPDDSGIVVHVEGTWRIKGIIQVSRSIGDAYLKKPEFALGSDFPRFRLQTPLKRAVLRADPSVCSRNLQSGDRFLIFASDGLWELLSNQKAVEIVHNNPREGIARRLVASALTMAARSRKLKYDDLKKYEKGNRRRSLHDDITVIVVFIDHEMLNGESPVPEMSVRGFVDANGPSDFKVLQEAATETNSNS